MSESNSADWIKARLPKGASFQKNGLSLTVSQAVTDALASNADNKFKSLAALLQILASDQVYNSESLGRRSWSGPALLDQAKYWEGVGDAEGDPSGITFPDATFSPRKKRDEFSRF
jgi:hypothetical protein